MWAPNWTERRELFAGDLTGELPQISFEGKMLPAKLEVGKSFGWLLGNRA